MAIPVPTQPQGFPLAPPQSAPPSVVAQQDEEGEGPNLLAIVWQARWLIALFTLLGGVTAWAYLQQAIPRYTSTARIYVEQNMPKLLNNDALGGFSNKYLYTQAELIRSTSVLAAAVEAPELAGIETFRKTDNPLALVRKQLSVGVGDRDDIINISLELENPTDAAQIVNTVVDAYITKYAEERRTDVVEVVNILRIEKERRDKELEERRKALEDFRQSHVTLAVQSGDGNVVTEMFSVLSSELNQAQIQLLEAKTRYNRAKKMLENPDQAPYLMQLAMSEQGSTSRGDIENQIQNIEQNLVAQRAKWGEGYPSVKLLKESLDSMRERQAAQQEATLTAYIETLHQNYELLVQRRDELQRAYDKQFELATQVSQQSAKLAALEEAYERTARLCDILDERIKEVNLSEEVGAMNVSKLEIAAPGYQTFPDRTKTLSIGLAFGAMAGFGLAWLRDLLDQRLKSVEEIASVLQTPVVGAVPVLVGPRDRSDDRSAAGRVVALRPNSVPAEAVRTLRTALHFGIGGGSKTYVVTSPAPGDGKSTVASNLAIAMSQANQRVLIIDADMRKPTQHQIFGADVEVGFAAVLTGVVPAIEAVVPTGIPSLDILPCGRKPANPVELLNNGVFSEALEQLARNYDQIVIDSPPVLPVADARLISAKADCTLLVLRAERSTRRMSLGARDELLKVRTQRLGVIVNAAPMHKKGYGYGYGYGAYGAYGAYGQVAYGYGEEPENGGSRKRPRERNLIES